MMIHHHHRARTGIVLAFAVIHFLRLSMAQEGVATTAPAFTPSPTQAATPPDEWIDPVTGHRVVWLSRLPGHSMSLYFHQNAFTMEGDRMVFGNTVPGASNRIYVIDMITRKTSMLVDRDATGVIVGARSRRVYYSSGGSIYTTHIDTHNTRQIATPPPGWRLATVNADETLLAGTYMENPLQFDRSAPKSEWFNKVFEARRPQCLFTIDVRTGATNVFHRYEGWLGHVQFSPTDPNLLMFCHEGPWDKVDRIWNIRVDGTGLRLMHKREMDGEIAGHEFWSPDGKTIWFDLQRPRGQTFFLAGADAASGREIRYPITRDQWSVHYNITRDMRLFAGDGGSPKNVARATDGQWLWLFTPKGDGTLQAEKLCSMARHDYALEPNVNFTPDGKWIVFRGNMHGSPQVYAVEVAKAPAASPAGR
jgi:oligogalacturonide lyase